MEGSARARGTRRVGKRESEARTEREGREAGPDKNRARKATDFSSASNLASYLGARCYAILRSQNADVVHLM